jgi:hypothetical protein
MYPYDFEPSNKGINPGEIFAVMPLAQKYNAVFENLIEKATGQVADKRGITLRAFRSDKDLRTLSGWIQVMEHLYPAQIVLGVLTEEINANVFYELGIAHATQPLSRQILIAENNYDPRFDTKDLIFMRYDPADPAASVDELALWIGNALNSWSYKQELVIRKAIAQLSPFDFEFMMIWGGHRNFAIGTSRGGPENYQRLMESLFKNQAAFLDGVFKRHCEAIGRLGEIGLIGLNTETKDKTVYFSNYWTDLGNLVLMEFKIIDKEERNQRFKSMPRVFRGI